MYFFCKKDIYVAFTEAASALYNRTEECTLRRVSELSCLFTEAYLMHGPRL